MKILFTSDLYTTATNGVVTSVRALTEELEKRGHEIRILTLSENNKTRKEGNVYYMKSFSADFIYPDLRMVASFRNKYVDELIAWKPDVIHTHSEFFSYQFALRIAKKTGAPIIDTYHTLYEEYVGYVFPLKRLGRFLVRKLTKARLKSAAAVIAPTEKAKKVLLGYGMKNPLYVQPSGIDLRQHKMRLTDEERRTRRRELGFSDAPVLINLGRLGVEKNVDEVLHLFAQAYQKRPDIQLLIVGDGPAKEALTELAKDLEIEKACVFTGMVDPKKTQEYYQLGDIFVSASQSETQGLTYIEAMANGLPLLCRKDECQEGMLFEGENGYAYETEEEFSVWLNELLCHNYRRAQMGKASEQIAEKYDNAAFARAIEKIYFVTIKKREP